MEYLDTLVRTTSRFFPWNAFNTVTYMTDHIQGPSNDGQMTSSWYGRNRRVKLKTVLRCTALEMAEIVFYQKVFGTEMRWTF